MEEAYLSQLAICVYLGMHESNQSVEALKAKSDIVLSAPGSQKECSSPLKVLCAGILTQF